MERNHNKLKNLNLPLKSLQIRAFAFDLLFISFFSHFLMLGFTNFLKFSLYRVDHILSSRVIARLVQVYPLIFITTFFSYFFISLYLSNGKTLSSYLFNLCVYSKNQPELDVKTCFLRAATYTMPFGLFSINTTYGLIAVILLFSAKELFGMSHELMDSVSESVLLEDQALAKLPEDTFQSPAPKVLQEATHVIELPYNQIGVGGNFEDSQNVLTLPVDHKKTDSSQEISIDLDQKKSA